MLRIQFVTKSYRPNALITLRTSLGWKKDLPGLYEDDAWTFELELSEAQRQEGLEFKFVLDRRHWMLDPNLSLPGQDGEHRYDETRVRFDEGPHLITE